MTTGFDAFTHAPLLIKAEIAIAQNCLRQAATAAGGDSTGEAKERLANAKRSHASMVDLISRLPSEYDARGYGAKARIIEGEIDEQEKQTSAKSLRGCGRRVNHED